MIIAHTSAASAYQLVAAVARLQMNIFQEGAVETSQATSFRVVASTYVIPRAKKQTKEEKHGNEQCDYLTWKATVVVFPSVLQDNRTILTATQLAIARGAPEDKRILTV